MSFIDKIKVDDIDYDIQDTNSREILDIITPKNTASGRLLHFTDGLPLATFENKVDGNVEQETTTGKQLMDFANIPYATAQTTFTMENDIFSISSTAGTTGYKSAYTYITELIKNNSGKILKFYDEGYTSNDISLIPCVQMSVTRSDGTKFYRMLRNYQTNNFDSYTIPSDTSNISEVAFGIYTNNSPNAVANTLTIVKPMLYFDDGTEVEYEKYTGGQASPNPEYPQEIEVLEGYNLFNVNTITENTYITADGSTGTSSVTNLSDYIEVESETRYTLSYDYLSLLNTSQRNIIYYDKNKTYISGAICIPTDKIHTIITPSNAKYLRFSYDKNVYNIQIVEGTQKPYFPYGCIGYKVNGKNIINTYKLYKGMSYNHSIGVTRTLTEFVDNYVTVDENGIMTFSSPTFEWATVTIKSDKLVIGDYTINVERENGNVGFTGGSSVYICEELDNNQYKIINNLYTVQDNTTSISVPQNLTFSIENENTCLIVTFANNKVVENAYVKLKVQLELGDKATPYEPYQEQIVPLDLKGNWVGAINDDIRDYLVTDKKKYWLVKNVGKVVLDGSENWMLNGGTTDYGQYMNTSSTPDKAYGKINIISDKFISKYSNDSNSIAGRDVNSYIFLTIAKSIVSFDLNVFKTWLSNNNVTVYYQLAKPDIIYLGELPEPIKTFEGTNNIQVIANIDTDIETTYAVDIKKYTDNKLAEISSQII